jgi:uncharacterized repeat protein (TIGR01451 family)
MSTHRLLPALLLLGLLTSIWPAAGAADGFNRPPDPADGLNHPPAPAAAITLPPNAGRVHPALRRALAEAAADAYLPIIIEWPRAADLPARAASAADRLARRQQVIAALQADTARQAAPLAALLAAASAEGQARAVRVFWISPVIALQARTGLIAELAARDDVAALRLDAAITLQRPDFEPADGLNRPQQGAAATAWNLSMIRADLAASALGLDGAGVVVANLDTGVDWQHPALLTKYRGYRDRGPAVHRGNWHVSTDEPYLYPGDGYGHGTHTMGTIVGDDDAGNRVGVAPGARWIAVKLFTNAGVTYESWIHDAFQWVMAPEGDPALAPDVVNNSWGSDNGADQTFRADVSALRAADILPVFSAGNDGPRAGSVGSPGSYPEALAIGALDADAGVPAFSGRGPNLWGGVKPEVAAPGVQVVSAFPGGGWARGTGTSMAAPHVTGLAALLRQALADGLNRPSADQLAGIILDTARPLSEDIPNNDSGWGLVDAYAAGLRVTAHGEVAGRVIRPDGGGIARAQLTATPHGGGLGTIATTADASGAFTVALRPGLYDVEGRAFGFAVGNAGGVQVAAGQRRQITLTLTALPAGSVFGRVTDSATAAPLSATVTVDGTPVQTQADPITGLYGLALPAGDWTLRFAADAHRIVRRGVTVTALAGQALDVGLPPAPRILLVDSGPWYYGSQVAYFNDALETLNYPAALWPVRDLAGSPGQPGARPGLKTLLAHDVVIWSAPLDSPGLTGAGADLRIFLGRGGRLLLSGQDIAYFDGGGSIFDAPEGYFFDDLGLQWQDESELGPLGGVAAGPLVGITITLNTADSAGNQSHPDQIRLRNALVAQPALTWPSGEIGGAVAGTCRVYRAAWLGFGLEGAGPRPVRIETLNRLLDWLQAAPAAYGLAVTAANAPIIHTAGGSVTHTIAVQSSGALSDTIDVRVAGGPWPAMLILPDGQPTGAAAAFPIDSCSRVSLSLTVAIPPDAPVNARAAYTLSFRSQGDPTLVQTATVAVKTPAPLLLVDDERWYHYQGSYTTTLEALGLAYDVFETGGSSTPPTDTLKSYPLAVWTTGYDWYDPISSRDEARLSAFLEGGGRLLLAGQDILDTTGVDDFVRDRLGVLDAMLTVTTTEVMGLAGGPLGEDLGPWRLTYPFTNWSDAVTPGPAARAALLDQNQLVVGVAHAQPNWRTAFFPFPLEALDAAGRQTLIGRATLWLSPLGESRLHAPPFAAEGSRIPVTLTLGLADDAPRAGLRARLLIPPGLAVVPGSVVGPWGLDATGEALEWAGALAPGAALPLRADLTLPAPLPDGARVPLRAHLYAGAGLTVTADADVFVDVPWLVAREEATPAQLEPGETARYTITVQNIGLLASTARLTDTLPAELRLVSGSAWASRGAVTTSATRLRWSDALAPGEQAQIGFRGVISVTRPGARVADRAEVTDDRGRRIVIWAAVLVPARVYLPVVWK